MGHIVLISKLVLFLFLIFIPAISWFDTEQMVCGVVMEKFAYLGSTCTFSRLFICKALLIVNLANEKLLVFKIPNFIYPNF